MTREQEIREREQKATNGPWVRSFYSVYGQNENWIATTDTYRSPDGWDQGKVDADFIAHAREDVPYLLDENARLRAEIEELRKQKKAEDDAFMVELDRVCKHIMNASTEDHGHRGFQEDDQQSSLLQSVDPTCQKKHQAD